MTATGVDEPVRAAGQRSPTRADTWLTAPRECGPAAGFGVYLHVPFCRHRCGYCDFATTAVGDRDVPGELDRYVDALVTDLSRTVAAGPGGPGTRAEVTDWPVVTSVFLGGGTPSLLGGERIARVVHAVRSELTADPSVEITVECNPENADVGLFAALADAGVTRVSMGAQSFDPHVLEVLERGHGPQLVPRAVADARRAGVDQVGIDLIYGTPGETDGSWESTLERALDTGVDHVSAYALTVHANTPFGTAVATGVMPPVEDDVLRERFDATRQRLVAAGFDHYEVSNFAAGVSLRSRHNLLYWRHGDYLGVGVGAHGHLSGRRWWRTRSTSRYLDAIAAGRSPVAGAETLKGPERATERLMLGLRVREGLHPLDRPPIDAAALERTLDSGLVELAGGRLRCTERGWYLLDDVVGRLLA